MSRPVDVLVARRLAGPQEGDYVAVTTTNGGAIEGILVCRDPGVVHLLCEARAAGESYLTWIDSGRIRSLVTA